MSLSQKKTVSVQTLVLNVQIWIAKFVFISSEHTCNAPDSPWLIYFFVHSFSHLAYLMHHFWSSGTQPLTLPSSSHPTGVSQVSLSTVQRVAANQSESGSPAAPQRIVGQPLTAWPAPSQAALERDDSLTVAC